MQSEAINELATALSAAQGEFPPITKTQTVEAGSYTYRYADLADVLAVVRPVLAKHGLAVSQPLQSQAHLILETILLHKSGQWLASAYEVERRDKPQEQGSEITYARRYALASILGIAAEEDDDGKAAQDAKPATVPAAKPTAPVAKPQRDSTGDWPPMPPREPGDDREPGEGNVATMVPPCPECGTSKKVIRSKYAGKTWACLTCKARFGPPNNIPKEQAK